MKLTTKRLILRPYTTDDAPVLFAAVKASLDHLRPWMDWAQDEPSLEKAQGTITHFHAEMLAEKEIPLAVFLHDGTFVGSSGYFIRDKDVPYYEIGYWLDARHTGKGYMQEAVAAQTDALFNAHGANRVEIKCHADNHASSKVAKALGFMQEGRLRNARLHLGKTLADGLIFSHTPASWTVFRSI